MSVCVCVLLVLIERFFFFVGSLSLNVLVHFHIFIQLLPRTQQEINCHISERVTEENLRYKEKAFKKKNTQQKKESN